MWNSVSLGVSQVAAVIWPCM